MKKFIILLAALVTVASMFSGSEAVPGSVVGGKWTANSATDTTFTANLYIPGRPSGVMITNPDAECWIKVTHGPSASLTTVMFLPVSTAPIFLDINGVTLVTLNKTTTQRVGVFFIGD